MPPVHRSVRRDSIAERRLFDLLRQKPGNDTIDAKVPGRDVKPFELKLFSPEWIMKL